MYTELLMQFFFRGPDQLDWLGRMMSLPKDAYRSPFFPAPKHAENIQKTEMCMSRSVFILVGGGVQASANQRSGLRIGQRRRTFQKKGEVGMRRRQMWERRKRHNFLNGLSLDAKGRDREKFLKNFCGHPWYLVSCAIKILPACNFFTCSVTL